jgi:hypothetical protein
MRLSAGYLPFGLPRAAVASCLLLADHLPYLAPGVVFACDIRFQSNPSPKTCKKWSG